MATIGGAARNVHIPISCTGGDRNVNQHEADSQHLQYPYAVCPDGFVRGRPDPSCRSYMPLSISTHLCFHQLEVSTLTSAPVKDSSPQLSGAVCLTRRDEQGESKREGGCENSQWKTSQPSLKLGAVVAGGLAAGSLTLYSKYRKQCCILYLGSQPFIVKPPSQSFRKIATNCFCLMVVLGSFNVFYNTTSTPLSFQ